MSKGDSARIHEQMARAELIQRIVLRDNALVLYLGSVGAILGFIGGGKIGLEILLVIPFLAFGVTTIIEQHNVMIGLLGHYLHVELDSEYKKIKEFVPQWNGSDSFKQRIGKYPWLLQRKVAHSLLIVTPSVLGLILNTQYLFTKNILTVAWCLGIFFTVISTLTIFQASNYRNELFKRQP